jgi:hypothetical protein
MKTNPLYKDEVMMNNIILIKECLGAKPDKLDPVRYVMFRSYNKDYRWACVAKNQFDSFAIDNPNNEIVYSGAYRTDIFERLGVINP